MCVLDLIFYLDDEYKVSRSHYQLEKEYRNDKYLVLIRNHRTAMNHDDKLSWNIYRGILLGYRVFIWTVVQAIKRTGIGLITMYQINGFQ